MTPGADDRCPNCLQPAERAMHLNLCPDPLRSRQFRESVDELGKWISRNSFLDSTVFACLRQVEFC
jgi:hypothetical protein